MRKMVCVCAVDLRSKYKPGFSYVWFLVVMLIDLFLWTESHVRLYMYECTAVLGLKHMYLKFTCNARYLQYNYIFKMITQCNLKEIENGYLCLGQSLT